MPHKKIRSAQFYGTSILILIFPVLDHTVELQAKLDVGIWTAHNFNYFPFGEIL
jgi:hypothetical protein